MNYFNYFQEIQIQKQRKEVRAWSKTISLFYVCKYTVIILGMNSDTECIDCFITEEHHQDLGQGHMKDVGVAPPEGMNLCSCGWS